MNIPKGTRCIWKPAKARKGAFGAAWSYEPVAVEILGELDSEGRYRVKILDPKQWMNCGKICQVSHKHLIPEVQK